MSELTLFKSRAGTMGYVFRNGKAVHFIGGVYATSAKDEIEELTKECENGHPNYFIDSNQKTIDSEMMDPMAVLRAQIKQEILDQMKANDPSKDMGSYGTGKLEGIANSQTVNGAAAASESQAAAAGAPGGIRPAIQVNIKK